MARYPARYYDGLTARARSVEVEIAQTGLAIFDETGPVLASWPGEAVRLVERPRRGEPARLGLAGTTARLVVDDPRAVDALGKMTPHLKRRRATSGKAVARVALVAALAVASLAGIVFVLVPLLSVQLAVVTPESTKVRIGRAVLVQLAELLPGAAGAASDGRYCSNEDGVEALQHLVERLAADLPDPPVVRPVVVNSGMVNAFALPGGIAVLTRGLIDEAESAEEVAGVLAHELGHIAHDHATRALYRSFAFALLVGVLLGDLTGGTVAGGLAEWMLNSGYSRAAEREADSFALERLRAAGIGAGGLAEFFARQVETEEDSPLVRMLSTHPASAERLAHIRNAGSRARRSAMTERDWTHLRSACLTLRAEPALP